MEIVRIPNRYRKQLLRISDEKRLWVFDSLLRLSMGEDVENIDDVEGDILELIWRDAILMEKKNGSQGIENIGILQYEAVPSYPPSYPPSNSTPEVKGSERNGNEKKGNENICVLSDEEDFLSSIECVVGKKILTKEARGKLKTRLKSYSMEELKEAFLNLANEPDLWKIKNNGFRSLSWWLHSDDRIEEMRNCHKKMTKKTIGFSPIE